jgi:maltose/moltooligosaccharide transporter
MLLTQPQPARTPPAVLLALPAAALGVALSVQVSVLSWLLATRYGLAIDQIGMVWAAGPIAGIIGQVLVGTWSDRVWWLGGRRRPFLLVSVSASAAALLALPHLDMIASALGLASVVGVAIGVTLLLDLAVNIGLNPARAIIADLTAEGGERSIGFVWMQTLSGGFSVAAYAFGAWAGNLALVMIAPPLILALGVIPTLLLREQRGAPGARGLTFDARLVIACAAPLGPMAALVALLLILHGLEIKAPIAALMAFTGLAVLLAAVPTLGARGDDQRIVMRKVVMAHSFSWLGAYCLFIFLTPFLQQRMPALGADELGRVAALGLLSFNAVGALAPLVLLGPATRRFRRAHVHAAALLLMALSFAAIGLFVASPPALWLWLAIAGVGWGAMVSLPYAILSDRADARQLGLLLGVFNLAIVVPQLVASLGLGALAPMLADRGTIFLIGAASFAASALAWLFLPPLPSAPDQKFTATRP